jgi:hypothetical protein
MQALRSRIELMFETDGGDYQLTDDERQKRGF